MGSNNQKEIKYISHSNIRASVETRPPKLHNLLWFSPPPPPPFHSWQFMDLPHSSFASFCGTRISSSLLKPQAAQTYVSNEYINIHMDKIGWVVETPMN